MEVNRELWNSLTGIYKQAGIARQVWPDVSEPGAKLSRILAGQRPLDPSDVSRLADAIGCAPDAILDIFPYLKEEE